ncbi:hypothetical protein ACWC10_03055 [Streptomyces sp. NPDC001595]|uniref:hypothetical protein n=1 Tax=Streptomyces sp. NPDC001532 TaxID=3154520 RepID=UPI00331945CC
MAWDEWDRLKTQARGDDATGMRLNQYPADQGGVRANSADLVAHQDDLGAVGHEAYILWDELRTAADIAGAGVDKGGEGSTTRAASSLTAHGFGMGAGLARTEEIWTSQVKSVLQACAHISNHLDHSRKLHAADDARIGTQAAAVGGGELTVSELSKYFK